MGATTKSPAPSEEVVVVSDPHHGAVPASGAGGKPGLIVELRGNADEILSRLEASGLAVGRVIGAPVGEASATASAVATEPERDSQRASVGSPVAVAAAPAEGGAEQPEEGRAKERHRSYFGTPILEVCCPAPLLAHRARPLAPSACVHDRACDSDAEAWRVQVIRMRSMVLAVLLCMQVSPVRCNLSVAARCMRALRGASLAAARPRVLARELPGVRAARCAAF
jgi:hypothetical protein